MTEYRWGACFEDGCEKPIAVKKAGVCSMHYERARTGADPRTPAGWRGGLEKYLRLKALVDSGASLNEIRRTMRTDYRVVKRWFPEREDWPVGGGGDAYTIRQVNQDLQRMDDYGNLSARRSHN